MELHEDALLYGSPYPGVSPALRREWLTFRRGCMAEIADTLQNSRGDLAKARLAVLEREIARLDRIISKEGSC